MIIKSIELEKVCGVTSVIPENALPEVAFAGRSNVGKSSLLNLLAQRKSLARTSSTPGKTQTINYYLLNNELYLVDLPGYGYAKASKGSRESWGKLVEKYLNTSGQLKAIFLLLDIRHAPSADDVQMYEWIVYRKLRPVLIATKADKIKRSGWQKQMKLIRSVLGAPDDTEIIPFSSLKKLGREDVYKVLDSIGDKHDED